MSVLTATNEILFKILWLMNWYLKSQQLWLNCIITAFNYILSYKIHRGSELCSQIFTLFFWEEWGNVKYEISFNVIEVGPILMWIINKLYLKCETPYFHLVHRLNYIYEMMKYSIEQSGLILIRNNNAYHKFDR